MGLTTIGKNYALDALGDVVVKARLLDDVGAEVLDHLSASQDKTIAWGDATGGAMTINSSVTFQVKSGVTVAAISFRSSDGNTEYGRDELAAGDQETYANDGTYTLTSAEINLNAV